MSLTSIIIIFLVLCMAVGPVFMLQPSKRQRQLAALRTQAAKLGIRVREVEFNKQLVAQYSLDWPNGEREFSGPKFKLIKKDYAHEMHLLDYWEVQPQISNGELKKALLQLAKDYPQASVAVTITPEGYGMYWREVGGEANLNALEQQLKQGRDLLWPMLSKIRKKTNA